MPTIKSVKPHLSKEISELKKVAGVKGSYIWGSYARNIDNPKFRLRDIDVLIKTQFNSGDLLAIDENILKESFSNEQLEDQGYEPMAIKFSKKFVDLSRHSIDCWAISSDRKLLHWGPVPSNIGDSKDIRKEAERYASDMTGLNGKKISKASEGKRTDWHNSYYQYMNKCFEGMPTGWYKTEDVKIKELLATAIKI